MVVPWFSIVFSMLCHVGGLRLGRSQSCHGLTVAKSTVAFDSMG